MKGLDNPALGSQKLHGDREAMKGIDVRENEDGTVSYRARVRLKGHPPVTRTFPNLTLAKKWKQKTEVELQKGIYLHQNEAHSHTVGDAIDRYIQTILPTKPRDAKNVERHLRWWKMQIGRHPLSALSPHLIAEKRDFLLAETTSRRTLRSPATVLRFLAHLSVVLSTACRDWGWLTSNPMEKVIKPKPARGRTRFLDRDEIIRFLDACSESKCAVLPLIARLFLTTGMRHSELMKLRRDDVNFKTRSILLRQTKNDEQRTVPLAEQLIEPLQEHVQKLPAGCELLFPSPSNPSKPICIRSSWRVAVRRAGLKDFRQHDTRHTTASYLAMGGRSPLEIACLLGHKTLQMTKRYAHLSQKHTQEMVNKLAEEICI